MSISGSVELVRESTVLTEEERHLLSIVIGEVERLEELVTTMLMVGKPRDPDRRLQDLRVIVQEVARPSTPPEEEDAEGGA